MLVCWKTVVTAVAGTHRDSRCSNCGWNERPGLACLNLMPHPVFRSASPRFIGCLSLEMKEKCTPVDTRRSRAMSAHTTLRDWQPESLFLETTQCPSQTGRDRKKSVEAADVPVRDPRRCLLGTRRIGVLELIEQRTGR